MAFLLFPFQEDETDVSEEVKEALVSDRPTGDTQSLQGCLALWHTVLGDELLWAHVC
jgi:hypothetical protein